MQEFAGMLFTLKKREQNISKDDMEFYKYKMLGYYDGLDIHTVDKWYDLRPKGLLSRKLQIDLKTPFIDQYTIRALMPANGDELDKLGFAYKFWEEAGRYKTDIYQEYEETLKSDYPFISMSVINLTKKFIDSQSNLRTMQDSLIRFLKECVSKSNYTLRELHCAVFPSIGYSDFIILFHTDDLSKVANVISQLRGAVTSDGTMIISNCYSVCGLDRIYFDNKDYEIGQNVKISIRINLKEGISARDFGDFLVTEGVGEVDTEFAEEIRKNYYITFGNSDCLLLPEQSLDRYLKWQGPDQILNPGSRFFEQFIANVRTTVRVNGKECNQIGNIPSYEKKDLSSYEKKFQEIIEKYEKFLQEHNMHIRSLRALHQVMKNFLNIVQASHGFDIEYIIGMVFDALMQDVNYYISKRPVDIADNMSKDEKNEIEEHNKKIEDEQKCVVEVLELFKEHIGSFISDLIRSDRPFIEGNTLIHSSIGAATKLLFAYSAILERLTREHGEENNFIFIVLSGGCDRTEAIDLFAFEHSNPSVKKIIIIRIPEMSLYDIQGTLFRILHEYMHYVGDRKRKERYQYLVNALANYIAWEISKVEFNKERLKEFCDKATFHLSGHLKEQLEKEIHEKYYQMKDEVKEKIAESIKQQDIFIRYGKLKEEESFFASTLKSRVLDLDSAANIFKTKEKEFEKESEQNFKRKLYLILYEADKKLILSVIKSLENLRSKTQKVKDVYADKRLLISLQNFKFLQQNYVFRDAHPKDYDIKIKSFIDYYIGLLLENISLNDNEEKYVFEMTFSYRELVDTIVSSMVECFSDCCAIRITGMKVEDFLLSFIYELWEIEEAFPLTMDNILRLGADIKVMYGIEHMLSDAVKQSIRQKAQLRKEQGYDYKNVEEMIKRIDVILEAYQSDECLGIRKELEKYLQSCVAEKEKWFYKPLGNFYDICDIDTSEKIYQVIDEIIYRWKNFGKGVD